MSDTNLKELLDFDALSEAEKITGVEYKDDTTTSYIGMFLMQENSAKKNKILMSQRDTVLSNDLNYYIEVIEENGFEKVLEIPFRNSSYPDEEQKFYIYAHRDGFLLSFDTYIMGPDYVHVNGGKLYYNWKPNSGDNYWSFTSSGGWKNLKGDTDEDWEDKNNLVWVGDHDCREALIFNIRNLKENGTVLKKWFKRPHLWLIHHADTSDPKFFNYNKVTADRIAMLPEWVQEMIGNNLY